MSRLVRMSTQDAIVDALRTYGDAAGADRIARGDFDVDGWYTDRTILVDRVPVTVAPCGCVFDWTEGNPPRVGRTFAGCGDQQLDHLPLAGVAGAEMNEHGASQDGAA